MVLNFKEILTRLRKSFHFLHHNIIFIKIYLIFDKNIKSKY